MFPGELAGSSWAGASGVGAGSSRGTWRFRLNFLMHHAVGGKLISKLGKAKKTGFT
jgi:hypothetical protein